LAQQIPVADDDYQRAEAYAGYSHFRVTQGSGEGLHGFNASVTGNVTRHVGLKFDLSGHYQTNFGDRVSLYNYLGGVQLKRNSSAARLKPFAHALAGGARLKVSAGSFGFSESGFAAALGAGLDVRASDRFDVRVFQVDYNPTRFGGATQHNLRLGVGLVVH
jgi:hypothetical protein